MTLATEEICKISGSLGATGHNDSETLSVSIAERRIIGGSIISVSKLRCRESNRSDVRANDAHNEKKGERASCCACTLILGHVPIVLRFSTRQNVATTPNNDVSGRYSVRDEDEHPFLFAAVLALVVKGYGILGVFREFN